MYIHYVHKFEEGGGVMPPIIQTIGRPYISVNHVLLFLFTASSIKTLNPKTIESLRHLRMFSFW